MIKSRFVVLGLCVAVAAGVVTFGTTRAVAQDDAKVNAGMVRVTLENERVRVLDIQSKPGQKQAMHSHPAHVLYVVSGGKVRAHLADGTTSEVTYTTGETLYRAPVTHGSENIGTTAIHIIAVELK